MSRFIALVGTLALATLADNLLFGAFLATLTSELVREGIVNAVPACLVAFVAPSLLVAPLGARLVDRYGVHRALRIVKLLELFAVLLFAGFAGTRTIVGWAALVLVGAKAGLLAPVKYAAAPKLVDDRDKLLKANMLVASATAITVLVGMFGGYTLTHLRGFATAMAVLVGIAVVGLVTSFLVRGDLPTTSTTTADMPRSVRLSLLGIGWFWFFGTLLVGLLSPYTIASLHLDAETALLFVVCLTGGFTVGALCCSWLSQGVLEIGVVPVGAIGTTLFTAALFVGGIVDAPAVWHACSCLVIVGVCAAWQVVPLYAFVQDRTQPGLAARVAAVSDRASTLFVLGAALMLWLCVRYDVPAHWALLGLAFVNAVVAVVIYELIPEFMLRMVAWLLAHVMYRVRVVGRENLPRRGPAVLICNHVTFIDWLMIESASPLPVRFVMHYSFMKMPVARHVFKDAKIIPIAGAKEDPETLEKAFDRIADALANDEIVCIFPEGKLTLDGTMNVFRPGIEKIIARSPVPVVPMALVGMWDSFFSKSRNKGFMKRVRSKITLIVDTAIAPHEVNAAALEAHVRKLGNLT